MRYALIWLVLAASAACASAAEVPNGPLKQDPNLTPPRAPHADEPDTRLARRITYSGGYKRLHQVIEDLAQATGVTIRCGKGSADWQVRDLPLTVYAKDIPADKLLQAVADATHTLLTVTQVNGKNYYKVWKDAKREKILEDRLQAERQYAKDTAEWAWDALIKFQEMPDSALGIDLSSESKQWQLDEARAIGPILEHIGKGALEQVIAGKRIDVKPKDLPEPARSLLTDLVRRDYESRREERRKLAEDNPGRLWYQAELTDQDLERSSLSIWTEEGDYSKIGIGQGLGANPSGPDIASFTTCFGLADFTGLFKDCKDPRIPPMPKKPDNFAESRFDKDIGSPNLKLLETDSDWDIPLLKTKVKPEKPKDKECLKYVNALEALAKASGCTIICEDFLSHRPRYDVGTIIGREATIGEMLKSQSSNRWLVDEEARLIVGWDKWWCEGHWRMMPESILANLQAKLNSTGVELDDLTPITRFTEDRLMLWILDNGNLEGIRHAWAWSLWYDVKLWAVYDSLSAQDKALAKSDMGVPLGKLDTASLIAAFRQVNAQLSNRPDLPEVDESGKPVRYRLPMDPDAIARLSMKVVKHRSETITVPDPDAKNNFPTRIVPTPATFDKQEYWLKIVGDDVDVDLHGPPEVYFPVYSPEREKEIEKARKAKDAKDAK